MLIMKRKYLYFFIFLIKIYQHLTNQYIILLEKLIKYYSIIIINYFLKIPPQLYI